MYERVLENWLDNAIETTFQIPFCQILIGQGHKIVHSTRHGPMEMGKDIITEDVSGNLVAYQLKSCQGGRITLSQFLKIQTQIIQLMTQGVNYPGHTGKRHHSFLVTNGNVEEEVTRAIDDLNRSYPDAIGFPIGIIQKGELLSWAGQLEKNLWPSELEEINRLLTLYLESGCDLLSLEKFHSLLEPIFGFNQSTRPDWSAPEVRRRIASAALITSISLQSYEKKENHFALLSGWILFSAYAMGMCERFELDFEKTARASTEIAIEEIFLRLRSLCRELRERTHYVEGNALSDPFVYKGRFTLLVALMSVFWLWGIVDKRLSEEEDAFINSFIPSDLRALEFWGEGVLPQFLAYYWYSKNAPGKSQVDFGLLELLKFIAKIKNSEKLPASIFPSPYYSFEEVRRHLLRLNDAIPLGGSDAGLADESFRQSSFFAESLFQLLVRTNFKQSCKELWPEISKIDSIKFVPEQRWEYYLWRAKSGREFVQQFPLRKEWEELKTEAFECSGEMIPPTMKDHIYLLLLFVILMPYRATPEVVRYLGRKLDQTW